MPANANSCGLSTLANGPVAVSRQCACGMVAVFKGGCFHHIAVLNAPGTVNMLGKWLGDPSLYVISWMGS